MFEYQRLDLRGFGFRLVRLQKGDGVMIQCELIHTTLDDNLIPYEAVSYTWGALKRERHVYITGEILPVTSNLWQVLHDLRRLDVDRYLWVDGVCINQDDDLERGHQVQQMKHIYQRADRGIFYLSPYTTISQVIMRSLTLLQKQVAGSRWAPNDERWNAAWQTVQAGLRSQYDNLEARQREGLAYLLLSPFFRRVWILQEVASVHRASVFCGTFSIPAHIFAIGARIEGAIPNAHISAVLDLMQKSLDTTTNPVQGKGLASLLKQFSKSKASDERDKIYALLGLCEVREGAATLNPDYTISVREVVRRTVCHIYGQHFCQFLPGVYTVHRLIRLLKRPPSDVIESLVRINGSREAFFDYINGTEAPIEIYDESAIMLSNHLARLSGRPTEVLHQIFAWFGMHFEVISPKIVSLAIDKEWPAEVLGFLCQRRRKVSVYLNTSFMLNTRHVKVLEMLMKLWEDKVWILVSMKGIWTMLLHLPDDDVRALIPLLHGIDSCTKATLIHLRNAASKLARSFRNRDAVMLLWRLTSNTGSSYTIDSTQIKGGYSFGRKLRPLSDRNQITGGHEGSGVIASSILRNHFSGRPIQIDPRLDLSSTGKWRLR
ncbi:heterokaryon incompatibility protein-domain-containing protein [Xylaria scruposa]|nr:heterokaryon incompatibility protein-domain-containing protein [Xylaria scruposa]